MVAIVNAISDAKAAEAAQSAYYDPNQPQTAYVPPPYNVSTIYIKSKLKYIFNRSENNKY